MGLKIHICDNCGKEFSNYFEVAKYCSQECYREYKVKNSKLKIITCPICGNDFKQRNQASVFCSKKCAGQSIQKRIHCVCEYCNTEFDRKESEVIKNKHHYCSDECRIKAKKWNECDEYFLQEHYGKLPIKEIQSSLSEKKSRKAINTKAISLGLAKDRQWSDEEVEILKKYYPVLPFKEVQERLPNRSVCSILGEARRFHLFSMYYTNRKYTDAEDEFIINNYKSMKNSDIAKVLNREENAITQRANAVLKCYKDKSYNYEDLLRYARSRMVYWYKKTKENSGGICQITHQRCENISVHHIRSVDLLCEEAISILNLDEKERLSDYSNKELDDFIDCFMQLHNGYNEYICIDRNIHIDFHNKYGYGNNTREQWEEYLNNNFKY